QGLWSKGLIFVSPDQVHFVEKNVGRLPLLGLSLLFENERLSKEELVNLLWGYEYDPARHDTLLYALIHRIRGLLGPFGHHLHGSDHFYRIVCPKKGLNLKMEQRIQVAVKERLPSVSDWNIRQYQVLDLMREGRFWSVGDYARHFSVTTMTALRDLGQLHQKNVVAKAGSGRATKYGIFSKE
ncbi:MAG: DeoR family transcriptional regulator, partial [Bdellovibrionales bacterium]|nr:DeoR family transcriptional regulator [Bdellovibrionales bacterium]